MITASQRPHIQKMQDRLRAALANTQIYLLAFADLSLTLTKLGLDSPEAEEVTENILQELKKDDPLEEIEERLFKGFSEIISIDSNLLTILERKLKGRAQLIYSQVGHFFTRGQSILDWGCGDGQVTKLMRDNISHYTTGYDICYYPAPGAEEVVKQFDGKHIPDEDGFFEAALMTNVAHHEEDNAQILKELARVILYGGRLVVIETVPIEDDPIEFERTFLGDYVYNRLFHRADISVPGTYETQDGWIRRFAEVGFELEEVQPLGYDQPTIRDWHTLLVLRRKF